jgi:hypothetical protein
MKDGETVVHDHPVLGAECVARLDLDDSWLPYRYEDVTLIAAPEGRWAVSCIPFFVDDLHLGDIVSVSGVRDGRGDFQGVRERGQSWGFRMFSETYAGHEAAHRLIEDFHGAFEVSGRLIAAAIRGDEDADSFAERLRELEDNGLLQYETAERQLSRNACGPLWYQRANDGCPLNKG